MRIRTREAQPETIDAMWEAHRESVWRTLLSLTRDMDLADDLLQDTYVRAREGAGSYRGGDSRPWLVAIARNVYYSYARLRRTSAEVALGQPEAGEERPPVDLLALLVIRQTLADLPAALRTALVMKHYAGYTYQEIARHQRCPVGTAKWRVSEALGRLRLVLLERRTAMAGSAKTHRIPSVDYVYGVLPESKAAKVRAHLAACETCRKEAEELEQVVSALDALEGDTRQMHFLELDREGGHTLYVAGSHVNTGDQPLSTWVFHSGRGGRLEHYYQDDEDAVLTVQPDPECETLDEYTVTLPRPVPPGGRLHELVVFPHARSSGRQGVQRLEGGRSRLDWEQTPGAPGGTAYVQVVRLPAGAQLLAADPQPNEVKGGGRTTLVWRAVPAVEQAFRCTVEYRLEEAE